MQRTSISRSISTALLTVLIPLLGLLVGACSNNSVDFAVAGRVTSNEFNPSDRFTLANQCLSVHPAGGTAGLAVLESGYTLASQASGFFFKPSRLGHYLLYDTDGRYLVLICTQI